MSISSSCKHDFDDLLQNSLPLSTHISFGLCPLDLAMRRLDSSINF